MFKKYKLYEVIRAVTGLWLGYNMLRYGPDQVIAKSHGKPWKTDWLDYTEYKKLGLFQYVVHCYLAQLSFEPHQCNGTLCQSVILPHSWHPEDNNTLHVFN